MGATEVWYLDEGYSIGEVYRGLVEEAEYVSGVGSYNGTISTCSLGGCTLRFDKFTKTNLKKAEKFVEERGLGQKGRVNFVDFGIVGWDIIEVKKEVKKATPKYESKYIVRNSNGENEASFNKKTDADRYAVQRALEGIGRYYVEKGYVLVDGDSVVTETVRTVKRHKSITKPKLVEKENRLVKPVYKYLIYGLARS